MRLLPGLVIAGALLAGCERAARLEVGTNAATQSAPEFSEKDGLRLPEKTRESLGLQIADVIERPVVGQVEVQFRAYERTPHGALASGWINVEQAGSCVTGLSVELLGPGGSRYSGKVVRVSANAQAATGQLELLIQVEETSDLPEPGAFLEGRIILPSQVAATTIPREALLTCSEGDFVYTVNGEHFVRTRVSPGVINAGSVEITGGLYAGDQVALPVMPLWLTELAAIKGGQACCIEVPKGR